MGLAETVTEETERIDVLNSLIGHFKPHDSYDDSGIFHSLFLLRIALRESLLKRESSEDFFSGQRPFYSEHFRVFGLPVGGRAYYLAKGDCGNYNVKIKNFLKVQEPFNIYFDCEGINDLD